MAEIDKLLAFGQEVLTDAGAIAAAHFRKPLAVENKGEHGFDPVTAADRAVEAEIRERIADRFPTHGIVGEEDDEVRGASAWQWIVDPIDGTRAFLNGLPTWGCLLGLLRDGEPRLGFMHQPVVGETFCGDGARAWLCRDNGRRPLRTRRGADLADVALRATHPDMFRAAPRRFERLAKRVRATGYGGDCYNYCLLAYGLVDLVVEDRLAPYDILPLVPIVRGAGGWVTDLAGNTPRHGMAVAAGDQALHRAALRALGG